MLRFAIERDLQTLQSQAKAGSQAGNLCPAFLMLRSPCTDNRNLLSLGELEDRPDPPVIPRAYTVLLLLWKVLGSTRSEGVDVED